MQSEYALLYLDINAVSFALIAIILHKTRGLSKMVAQRNFAMSIISEMVLFESDTPENAELLKKSIVDNLKEINERTQIPFELTVSIGIASSDGFLNLKEFIDLADEEMYKAKEESRKGDA